MDASLPTSLLAFGLPGHGEWLVLLVLGLLIFGKRLPDVGRSIGRSIVEFKKGIKGIEEEIDEESSRSGKRLTDESSRPSLPKRDDRAHASGDAGGRRPDERAEPRVPQGATNDED